MPPSTPPAWLLRKPAAASIATSSRPRAFAAEHAARVVAAKARGRELVAMLAAALRRGARAGADLHGLHGVDAHEGVGDVCVQSIEHRFTQSRRDAARHHRDARADRIARAAHFPDQLLELGDAPGVRTEERILVSECRIHRLEHQRPDLTQVTVDAHAEARGEIAARNRARGGPHHRLTRRRAPAAAVVAHAVFLLVGVVRVSWAEAILDLVVVARASVGVINEDADRGAGRASFKHPREDAYLVGFAPLTDEMRRAAAAAVDILLQIRLAEREARRAAVDDATHGGPVALAKRGHREQPANGVAGHGRELRPWSLLRVFSAPAVARATAGILRRHRARIQATRRADGGMPVAPRSRCSPPRR